MPTSEDHQIDDSIQFLKTEILELEARLRDRRQHGRANPKSISRRMLVSAQRVDELISKAYP
ncbi:MAG TPA: hypothetical protein VIX19_09875 [Terriglobales bacterium]